LENSKSNSIQNNVDAEDEWNWKCTLCLKLTITLRSRTFWVEGIFVELLSYFYFHNKMGLTSLRTIVSLDDCSTLLAMHFALECLNLIAFVNISQSVCFAA
jgi:hypothetical protein